MPKTKIYTTEPIDLDVSNFNPRNYDPIYLFVKKELKKHSKLEKVLSDDLTGGSPPPAFSFRKKYEIGVPFIKTSAISRDFVNVNDLHFISPDIHKTKLKRSITTPYNVIFSMTGKFMGKAALCPPTIKEMNMSQNSVVLKCESPIKAAFLCIFLNSEINQTQIKGIYSITKQKYLSQTKIKSLHLLEYNEEYEKDLLSYIENIEKFYNALDGINNVIEDFNEIIGISSKSFDEPVDFIITPDILSKRILTCQYYRKDFYDAINSLATESDPKNLSNYDIITGDEIGSKNYIFEGVPFIKTSNFINYGVDYQPNYYCSEAIYSELEQDLKKGDLLFTKDGKIGEVAVLNESAKVVISSGITCLRPSNDFERYWLFLLLSSNYGKTFFNKWTVIASTMAHLRKDDFFEDFKIPIIEETKKEKLLKTLENNFKAKEEAYYNINKVKKRLLDKFYETIKM